MAPAGSGTPAPGRKDLTGQWGGGRIGSPMSARRLLPLYVLLAVVAVVGLAFVPWLTKQDAKPRRQRTGNPMGNPPGSVDRLVMVDSADAFGRGKLEGLNLLTPAGDACRLVLKTDDETKDYPRRGTWTSEEVQTDYPFTEIIPSWNLTAPPDTGVYFEIRSHDVASAEWSPWMYIGYWGRVRPEHKVDEFPYGTVNTDNLTLKRPADAYQIRATFQSFQAKGTASPALRRVAVCYTGVVKDEASREQFLWKPEIAGTWAVDLHVPYRAQGDSTKALSGEICSPTSTSMVMQYCGVNRPTVENAEAIYDNDAAMFGNWGRAVARAGELGLDGWVTRFRNWDQVKAMIAAGQPIICSIKAKKGDFQGPFIYEATNGHLIVLRGLTPDGNAIVNDPARRAKGDGFVYNKEDMERIWIGHGGVGYIIHKPAGATTQPVVAVGGK